MLCLNCLRGPVLILVVLAPVFAQTCATSMTGTAAGVFSPLDQAVMTALQQNSVKGAVLAMSYNGRLVFARGYGCGDVASNAPTQPDTLMRIASVSKTFTSIGVLQLVQQGKLSLDAKVFGPSGILSKYQPLPGKTLNPDLLNVTVRHLLQHSGGWDRSTTQHFNGAAYNEPLDGLVWAAAQALGNPLPSTASDVIRVMLSQPIQHTPGTYYAYSNFGYSLAGRVIEAVSGLGYEQYVQQNILKPLGISRQKLAASLESDVVNGEATYYDASDAPLVTSVFPNITKPVPRPYGGKVMEDVDSAGAWVANAIDLCRFLDGIEGKGNQPALLNAASLRVMTADPKLQNQTASAYAGLGFNIYVVSNGLRWTKDGGLPGTSALLIRTAIGYSVAMIFNGSPSFDPSADETASLAEGVSTAVLNLIGQVSAPSGDQYPNYTKGLLTPVISGVTQGATFQPGIVAGSWVTISGQNLANTTRIWWNNEIVPPSLPAEVDHVLVTINNKPASVYYVSPTQLNIQAPTDTATGAVNVVVTRDGVSSAPFQANLKTSAPGFFTYSANGRQYLSAIHLTGAVIGDIAGTLPAKAGETVELYATGLNASQGGQIPSAPIALSPLPAVTMEGINAVVSYAGIVSPGLYQINAVIPNLPGGVHPVVISYGGASSPSGPVIATGN